jgi:hypothetical protein
VANIVTRVFADFTMMYEDVGKEYGRFFCRHWNEIKVMDELEVFLSEVDEGENCNRRKAINKRYRELMRALSTDSTGST